MLKLTIDPLPKNTIIWKKFLECSIPFKPKFQKNLYNIDLQNSLLPFERSFKFFFDCFRKTSKLVKYQVFILQNKANKKICIQYTWRETRMFKVELNVPGNQ